VRARRQGFCLGAEEWTKMTPQRRNANEAIESGVRWLCFLDIAVRAERNMRLKGEKGGGGRDVSV
jgi:hypothetical protein